MKRIYILPETVQFSYRHLNPLTFIFPHVEVENYIHVQSKNYCVENTSILPTYEMLEPYCSISASLVFYNQVLQYHLKNWTTFEWKFILCGYFTVYFPIDTILSSVKNNFKVICRIFMKIIWFYWVILLWIKMKSGLFWYCVFREEAILGSCHKAWNVLSLHNILCMYLTTIYHIYSTHNLLSMV